MRAIEELYDSRYARDTADLRDEADGTEPVSVAFPQFAYEFYSKRLGLRSLVDQACRELLFNVHASRKEYLEVEIFARFLEVCVWCSVGCLRDHGRSCCRRLSECMHSV